MLKAPRLAQEGWIPYKQRATEKVETFYQRTYPSMTNMVLGQIHRVTQNILTMEPEPGMEEIHILL